MLSILGATCCTFMHVNCTGTRAWGTYLPTGKNVRLPAWIEGLELSLIQVLLLFAGGRGCSPERVCVWRVW